MEVCRIRGALVEPPSLSQTDYHQIGTPFGRVYSPLLARLADFSDISFSLGSKEREANMPSAKRITSYLWLFFLLLGGLLSFPSPYCSGFFLISWARVRTPFGRLFLDFA